MTDQKMKSAEEFLKEKRFDFFNDINRGLTSEDFFENQLPVWIKEIQANALASSKSALEVQEQKAEAFDFMVKNKVAISKFLDENYVGRLGVQEIATWTGIGKVIYNDMPEQAVLELKRKLEQK